MKFGEFCLTAAALIIASVVLATVCAFFAWAYDDWKKNRRDW
jgi:hypothetical protein